MTSKKRARLTPVLCIPGILAGKRYLQCDDFADTLAAGAVNGTLSTPGPGTRTVVDAENKYSLSGGELVSTGGKATPASGNPALWLNAIARATGRLMICKITLSATNTNVSIGFDTSASGSITDGMVFTTTGTIRPFEGGGQKVNCNLFNYAATDYKVAIVTRSAGHYIMMRGGAATYWTLLWVCKDGFSSPLMASINNYNAAFSADFLRVPKILWLPIPLAYDTFTRSNGGLNGSSTNSTGPDGQTATARTWVDQVGALKVSGNVAGALTLSGGLAIGTIDAGNANILMRSALTVAGGYSGFVLRYVDEDNYVVAYHDGTNAYLGKVVSGSATELINVAAAYSAGAYLVVVASGTSFELYYNDAKIGSTQTIADAGLQSGTKHGLIFTDISNTADNLAIFPRGDGNEYSFLDTYSG